MNCAAFKDNVAAYVLGILDPDERQAFEAHLAEPIVHEGCSEALAEGYETTALLGAALPPLEPGPHVWQAIERELGLPPQQASARMASAARPPALERAPRVRRSEIVAWTLAAAAVLAAFVFGMQVRTTSRMLAISERDLEVASAADRDKQICLRELATSRVSLREREAALSLLGSPGTQLVQLAAQGSEAYHASALLNPGEKAGMILTTALKPLQGKDYQLWLIRGDEKISGGILRTDPSGASLERISDQVLQGGRPDAFAVTIEPQGGMPQPTGPIILLGKVPTV